MSRQVVPFTQLYYYERDAMTGRLYDIRRATHTRYSVVGISVDVERLADNRVALPIWATLAQIFGAATAELHAVCYAAALRVS